MNRIPALTALALLMACGTTPDSTAPKTGETGAMLSVDYFGDTDVIGFHFDIERVACDGDDAFTPFTVSANVDLLDGIVPAMLTIVEQTYDSTSRHLASDLFVTLEAGCYDVLAAPASAFDGDDWTPSADCSTASQDGIEIVDGLTTETILISQCVGDEAGALDTLVTLNHPPQICGDDGDGNGEGSSTSGGSDICDGVVIDEKYNYECEPVSVCVTAFDVDDDPLEFVIANTGSLADFAINTLPGPTVVDFADGHRIWEQCYEVVTRWTGSYEFTIDVYDLGNDGGSHVRIESLVDGTSNDDLAFPIHTNWIEEPMCFDETDTLVEAAGSEVDRYPGCGWTDAETFYCSGAYDHMFDASIKEFLCDGTTLIEEALYPECPA